MRLGRNLREAGSNDVALLSVRHSPGRCIGAYRPPDRPHPTAHERHLRYLYDGTCVSRWFDYTTDTWHPH